MSLHEYKELDGKLYKYSLEGSINIGAYNLDLIINVPKDSNVEREELEYINPIISGEDEIQEEAVQMFITAISDYIKLPVGNTIKTIEVKGKTYEAGLPGLIVELGNCIKTEDIE